MFPKAYLGNSDQGIQPRGSHSRAWLSKNVGFLVLIKFNIIDAFKFSKDWESFIKHSSTLKQNTLNLFSFIYFIKLYEKSVIKILLNDKIVLKVIVMIRFPNKIINT